MGVKDLNKLIKNMPYVTGVERDYAYVIVDCSNLITTFLMRHLVKFPKTDEITFSNYSVTCEKPELIVIDYQEQVRHLVNGVLDDLKDIYLKCKSFESFKRMILVSDPTGEYKYKYIYNDDVKMTCIDNKSFSKWAEIKGFKFEDEEYDITFTSKEEEKKVRVAVMAQQVLPRITITRRGEVVLETNTYEEFADYSKEGLDPELSRIYRILYQSTLLIKHKCVFDIVPVVQREIAKWISDKTDIDYYLSDTEADIFIKAYYHEFIKREKDEDEKVLVVSNDTDYVILFGECKDAAYTVLSPFNLSKIRSPYAYWTDVFGDMNTRVLRMLLARLSALYGNDYTCHKRKIVCEEETVNLLPFIFNVNGDSVDDDMDLPPRKSISRFIKDAMVTYHETKAKIDDKVSKGILKEGSVVYQMMNSFRHIDKVVLRDPKLFIGYFETLLIYMNYAYYSSHTDMRTIEIYEDHFKHFIRNHVDTRINYAHLDDERCFKELK